MHDNAYDDIPATAAGMSSVFDKVFRSSVGKLFFQTCDFQVFVSIRLRQMCNFLRQVRVI